jgi:hypothetical protein
MMTPERLDAFKVVILANARCLSDAQCRMLEDYVARGGSVVAAFETSTRDENGNPRGGFGLEKVFGARLVAEARGPVKNTYVALNGEHPINRGYDGAARIMGGTRLIEVETVGEAEEPFRFVPDFPDLPMEEVYPREEPRGGAVIARDTAGGRTVYIPWNIGGIFWQVLTADHGRLIANAVRWALKEPSRVEVSGKAVLDLALRENANGLAIILHNLTNPMMLKGPTREIYPVGPQTVSVALDGRGVASARALVSGRELPVRTEGGRAIVEVPGIDTLEVVHLTWR